MSFRFVSARRALRAAVAAVLVAPSSVLAQTVWQDSATNWNADGSWSALQPTSTTLAQFNLNTAIANQPALTAPGVAMGLSITNGSAAGTADEYTFSGAQTLTLHGSGITVAGGSATNVATNTFAPNIALAADQVWDVAANNTVVLNGTLGGAFNLTKSGGGAVNYANTANATHVNTTITAGRINWNNGTTATNPSTSFGSGLITLNGGRFHIGAAAFTGTITLTNAFEVGASGGTLSTASSTNRTYSFTGALALGGHLTFGMVDGGGGGGPGGVYAGTITLDQSSVGTRQISITAGGNHGPTISGNIVDGVGAAGNKLVLRAVDSANGRDVTISGTANAWAGGTDILAGTNGRFINVAAASKLGTGNVTVADGAALRLQGGAANLGAGSKVTITHNTGAFTGLGLGGDTNPASVINTAASSGGFFLGIDAANTTASIDLGALGTSGDVVLGSSIGSTGTFSGVVAAKAGSGLYRLGSGGGTLTLSGVNALTGNNNVTVGGFFAGMGNNALRGGTLILGAANNVVGTITIAAGDGNYSNTLASRVSGAFGSGNTVSLTSSTSGAPTLRFENAAQSHGVNVSLTGTGTANISANVHTQLSGTLNTGNAVLSVNGTNVLEWTAAPAATGGRWDLNSATGGAVAAIAPNVAGGGDLPTTMGLSLNGSQVTTLTAGVVVLGGNFTWSDFIAGRTQVTTTPVAGQWRLNGGGFAARGSAATITSGNFDANFMLGTPARDGTSALYADAPLTISPNINLTATRTVVVAHTGPGLTGSIAGSVSHTLGGSLSGVGALQVQGNTTGGGNVQRNAIGELVLAGSANNWTGGINSQINTGPGGLAIPSSHSVFVRFNDTALGSGTSIPAGDGSTPNQFVALQNNSVQTSDSNGYAYGFLFTGDADGQIYNLPAYTRLVLGTVNGGGSNRGGTIGATSAGVAGGSATLGSAVIAINAGDVTSAQDQVVFVRDGSFTLGTAAEQVRFIPTSQGTATAATPRTALADNTTGTRTLIKRGPGLLVIRNVDYRTLGTNGDGDAGGASTAGRFLWVLGVGPNNLSPTAVYTADGAVRETATSGVGSLSAFPYRLNGAVLELDVPVRGTAVAMSANSTATAGQINFFTATGQGIGGGFAAVDTDLSNNAGVPEDVTLTLTNGAGAGTLNQVGWAGTPTGITAPASGLTSIGTNGLLMFGSRTGNATLRLDTRVNLGSSGSGDVPRGVQVLDDANPAKHEVEFLQPIHGNANNALVLIGDGRARFTATSVYTGQTRIYGGTALIAADVTAGATGPFGNPGTGTSANNPGSSAYRDVLLGSTVGTDGNANAAILLDGPFTFARNVIVQAGNLGVATLGGNTADASAFSGLVTLNKNLTLTSTSTGGNAVTFSGDITGSGGITKTGAGRVSFTGTGKNYSGGTVVSAGELLASNTAGSATGSGGVSVAGGTFGGSGSIAGKLTVTAAGILSPGGDGIDSSLNLTGGQEWQSGGTYVWEISNAAGGAGTGWDLAESLTATIKIASNSSARFNVQIVQSGSAVSGLDPDAWFTIAHAGAVVDASDVPLNPADLAGFASLFSLPTSNVGDPWEIRLVDVGGGGGFNVQVSPVPEPGSLALAALGAIGLLRRRRKM